MREWREEGDVSTTSGIWILLVCQRLRCVLHSMRVLLVFIYICQFCTYKIFVYRFGLKLYSIHAWHVLVHFKADFLIPCLASLFDALCWLACFSAWSCKLNSTSMHWSTSWTVVLPCLWMIVLLSILICLVLIVLLLINDYTLIWLSTFILNYNWIVNLNM